MFIHMDREKQRRRIFWLAFGGIGGSAYVLGFHLSLAIGRGYGWWKVALTAFVFLYVARVFWRALGQLSQPHILVE
jgi:dolichyl-phosphate-mannose--protein O-mannosyl transferase